MPRINQKLKLKIQKMAEIGVPDIKICKKTGLSEGSVSKITTEYWAKKMKNK
tara:strand:+ start:3610 stop:3765 length:156 start_codon:yes stop_codon:yes gene_type:complete